MFWHPRMVCCMSYPIDQVEDESHSHAKLLKVQLAVIVHIR
jgi:hypothetical protein